MSRAPMSPPTTATIAAALALVGSVGHASPRVDDLTGAARQALASARRECTKPGRALAELVARYFDAEGFAARVVADWRGAPAPDRAAFLALADRVAGEAERASAVHQLCARGTIESADVVDDDGNVRITLRAPRRDDGPDPDDCARLMFHREPTRAWRFDGTWFCGKSSFVALWRRRLGGSDDRAPALATARAHLEALADAAVAGDAPAPTGSLRRDRR